MINKNEWMIVGLITSCHGINGQVKVKSLSDFEERFLKPGISGWAQVNYHYGASVADTKQKLSYDIYYISNFSFFLDLLIFFKTIKLVLNAKGYKPKKIIIDNNPNTN